MKKEILFSKETIEKRIEELAKEIDKGFNNKKIIILCVLKGSFIFTADLIRKIKSNCQVEFIKASSYGNKTESSGIINLSKDIMDLDIENKNVLIVEDILDSGLTLSSITSFLIKYKNPKILKTCVLLDKKERRKVGFDADYIGFEIPDKFVIGYGLDYNEKYRNLSEICTVEEL